MTVKKKLEKSSRISITNYIYRMGPVGSVASSKKSIQFRQRATNAILPQLLTACVVVAGVLVFGAYILPLPTLGGTATPVSTCGTYSGDLILTQDISTSDGNCISLNANSTLDGNGHSITVGSSGYAIWIYNRSNISVTNVVSTAGVYIAEDTGTGSNVSLTHSQIGAVTVYSVDDVTIDHVAMTSANIYGTHTDPVLRTVFTNNTVTSDAHTLVSFLGGDDHAPCPRTDFVVTDNVLTSSYQCGGDGQERCDEPKVLFMYCGTHNTVQRNTVHALGQAMAARFRDNFDDSTVSNNIFWSHEPQYPFGATTINAGSVDTTPPARNTFSHNTFRTDIGPAIYFSTFTTSNRFEYNLFWGNDARNIGTIDGGRDTVYDHNTIYNSSTGPLFVLAYRTEPTDTWTNNIFSYSGTNVFNYDGFNFSRYSGDNNIFFNRSGAVSFGGSYPTLAAWKIAAAPDDSASIAADPLFGNASTGDFTLQEASPARGVGSGGSDIGAYAYSPTAPACTESWSCGSWSTCTSGSQTRTCTDANSCGTTVMRPALTQSCACTESWTCGTWTSCSGGTQSRTCTDTHACGSATNRPAIQQSCADTPASCTESWSCGAWSGCVGGMQTRTCTEANGCGTTIGQPALSQVCAVNPGPTITILHPTGKRVAVGIFTASATVKDSNGVAEVRFLIDGTLVGRDTRAPYAVNIDTRPLRNGVHIISIQATDKLGAISQANREFTTRNSLLVRIFVPNKRGIVSGTVALRPRLIYGGTPITLVEYWLDRRPLLTSSASPFSVNWDSRSVKNGTHRFSIRVTDTTGKQAVHTVYLRVKN